MKKRSVLFFFLFICSAPLLPSFATYSEPEEDDSKLCLTTYFPEEIRLHILSFLTVPELLKTAPTCQIFNNLVGLSLKNYVTPKLTKMGQMPSLDYIEMGLDLPYFQSFSERLNSIVESNFTSLTEYFAEAYEQQGYFIAHEKDPYLAQINDAILFQERTQLYTLYEVIKDHYDSVLSELFRIEDYEKIYFHNSVLQHLCQQFYLFVDVEHLETAKENLWLAQQDQIITTLTDLGAQKEYVDYNYLRSIDQSFAIKVLKEYPYHVVVQDTYLHGPALIFSDQLTEILNSRPDHKILLALSEKSLTYENTLSFPAGFFFNLKLNLVLCDTNQLVQNLPVGFFSGHRNLLSIQFVGFDNLTQIPDSCLQMCDELISCRGLGFSSLQTIGRSFLDHSKKLTDFDAFCLKDLEHLGEDCHDLVKKRLDHFQAKNEKINPED